MNAYPMPTYQFEMAPLDEFVVTERKYPNHKDLPRVHVDKWLFTEEWGNQYHLNGADYDYTDGGDKMYIKAVKPTDCEVWQNECEIIFDPMHWD